jgi:hypothetical protein
MRSILLSALLAGLLGGCAYTEPTSASDTIHWPNKVIKIYDAKGNRTGTAVIRR